MFVDASVVVAIINQEEGYEGHVHDIESNPGKAYCSPLVIFEATAAIARSRSGEIKPTPEQFRQANAVVERFFDWIKSSQITITPAVGDRAIAAAAEYGKFTGHMADLNFGDCYSYACAKAYNIPLLYKGDDFAQTDLA